MDLQRFCDHQTSFADAICLSFHGIGGFSLGQVQQLISVVDMGREAGGVAIVMYAAICDMLQEMPELPLNVICHQKVRLLIRDHEKLTDEERRYATHPNTHVDFLIYNRITKSPVLAIEVDGFHYHKEGTQQAERDQLKNGIFAKYEIPLLRLPTNGSGEIQKIKAQLLQN
jgi:hypothetical protein